MVRHFCFDFILPEPFPGRSLWTCEVGRNAVRNWVECERPDPHIAVFRVVSCSAQPAQRGAPTQSTTSYDVEAQPLLQQYENNNVACEASPQCSLLASVRCGTCARRLCDDHCISRCGFCGTYYVCGDCSASAERWRLIYTAVFVVVLLGSGGGLGGYFATH